MYILGNIFEYVQCIQLQSLVWQILQKVTFKMQLNTFCMYCTSMLPMCQQGIWENVLFLWLQVSGEGDPNSIQYVECQYYLKTYASFYTIIDFHRRNGRWMKAVQFVLDQVRRNVIYLEFCAAFSIVSFSRTSFLPIMYIFFISQWEMIPNF